MKYTMESDFSTILGLEWHENWRFNNGDNSHVIPFPTLRPVNLVFHGENRFTHGHYGTHLGQGDKLTFLGPSTQRIKGYFIDCRKSSPTLHKRVQAEWTPSSGRSLYIPNGVAHSFDGLENVFTLNHYRSLLPDPKKWLEGDTQWTPEGDVINFPMDVSDEQLPLYDENPHDASDVYYQVIAENQRISIPNLRYEFPTTKDVSFADGKNARLVFYKQHNVENVTPDWTEVPDIQGLGWAKHLVVWSGGDSGFVPILDRTPFYIVDHGEVNYSHDTYSIHLGREDRLTFVGHSSHTVRIFLVDCRSDSPTLHNRISFDFSPSPLRLLVIPNGVAHRFEGLEKVYTINRPNVFTDGENTYQPVNDVIYWPIDQTNFPKIEQHKIPASQAFYMQQIAGQKQVLASTPRNRETVSQESTINEIR